MNVRGETGQCSIGLVRDTNSRACVSSAPAAQPSEGRHGEPLAWFCAARCTPQCPLKQLLLRHSCSPGEPGGARAGGQPVRVGKAMSRELHKNRVSLHEARELVFPQQSRGRGWAVCYIQPFPQPPRPSTLPTFCLLHFQETQLPAAPARSFPPAAGGAWPAPAPLQQALRKARRRPPGP